MTVADRYAEVLMSFPQIVGRSLYDNFDDIAQDAYDSRENSKVVAASDLMSLRWRLFDVLEQNTLTMRHITDLEKEACKAWLMRLRDQQEVCGRRNRKKKSVHTWMN